MNVDHEEWRPVTGFERDYLVSSIGRIWSNHTQRILKSRCSVGYEYVVLCAAGMQKTLRVHRIVAQAFIPNPDCKPTVNHINEVKTDNRVENLEWATTLEQNTHGTRIARAVAHTDWVARTEKMDYAEIARKHNYHEINRNQMKPVLQYDKRGFFIARHDGISAAARAVNRRPCNICECAKGRRKTCAGYRWEYENADETSIAI